jgi:transcriptional regulator with XRE-family HTH domain
VDMPKFKKFFEEMNVQQKDCAELCGIDAPLMSKIVNGAVLPNKASLEVICNTFDRKPLDFYERAEINLSAVGKVKGETLEPDTYRLSVRIPRDWCEVLLDEQKMKVCGYISITDWVRKCLGRLAKQHEAIEKWQRSKNGERNQSNLRQLRG